MFYSANRTIYLLFSDVISLVEGASPGTKSRPLVCMVRHSSTSLALSTKRRQDDPSRVAVKIAEETQPSTIDQFERLVHGDTDETTTEIRKFDIATEAAQAHGYQNESETAMYR